MSSNTAAVALAESCANLYATSVCIPTMRRTWRRGTPETKKLVAYPKVIAVGETGLDYYYNHSPREVQRRVLRSSSLAGEDCHLSFMSGTLQAKPSSYCVVKGGKCGVILLRVIRCCWNYSIGVLSLLLALY